MAVPFARQVSNHDQTITAAQVDHLPIIAHYARRLGLVEMINGLVPVEMEVEPGVIALGLVLGCRNPPISPISASPVFG